MCEICTASDRCSTRETCFLLCSSTSASSVLTVRSSYALVLVVLDVSAVGSPGEVNSLSSSVVGNSNPFKSVSGVFGCKVLFCVSEPDKASDVLDSITAGVAASVICGCVIVVEVVLSSEGIS